MTQKCETDRACDAAGPGDLSALPADIPENCTSVSQGQEAISLELQIAIEDVVVDAFGDMLDASVNMTVTAVEAGLGGDELQLLVAGLQKTADPLAAEAIAKLIKIFKAHGSAR